MINLFCTISDLHYVPRVLVLRASLLKWCDGCRFVVLATDERTRATLVSLGVETVDIRDFEAFDPELAEVRPTRKVVEYCWTAKAPLCRFLFARHPEVATLTYVDGDLAFFSSPRALLDRHAAKSVLLVPHRYSSSWSRYLDLSGRFNGGFVSFRPGEQAQAVLLSWREQCLDWCFDRFEDGRFSDQKYLEDWPSRFSGVGVIDDLGAGLAPWNASGIPVSTDRGAILVSGSRLVFYHYHGLKLFRGIASLRRIGLFRDAYRLNGGWDQHLVWQAAHPIGERELELVWLPYIRSLTGEVTRVQCVDRQAAQAAFETVRARAAAVRFVRGLGRRVVPTRA